MSDTACIFTYLPSRLEIKLPINGQLVLGRGVMLDIKTVHMSRRQVEITSVDGRVYITRQGTNKSLLNGLELVKNCSTELKDGDSITLLEKEYPVKVSISQRITAASPPSPLPAAVSSTNGLAANPVEARPQGEVAEAPNHQSTDHPVAASSVPQEAPLTSSAHAAPERRDPVRPKIVDGSLASVAHQLQAEVRKERNEQAMLAKSDKEVDIHSANPQRETATTTTTTTGTEAAAAAAGESESADEQENDSGRSSASDEDDHISSSRGDNNKRSNKRTSLNKRKDTTTTNNTNHPDNDELENGIEDAVIVEDYLSDESSFVCSEFSDLEADQSDGHFNFAKIHKVKRQGRVEVLD